MPKRISRMLGSLMIFPPIISRCLKHFCTTTTAWECGWGYKWIFHHSCWGCIPTCGGSRRGYTMLYPIISPSTPTSGGCYTDHSDYISLSSSHPLYNSIQSLRFSRPWHQNRTRSCNRSWCTWEFPPPSQLLDETSAVPGDGFNWFNGCFFNVTATAPQRGLPSYWSILKPSPKGTILSWGLPNGGRNCGSRRQRLRWFPGSRLGKLGEGTPCSRSEREVFSCFFPCVGGFPNFLVGKTGRLRSLEQHNGSYLLFPTASPRPWPRVCRNSWCACASSETVNWQSWRTSFRPPRRAIWGCHGRRFGPRQARWMVRLGKLIESLIICSYFDGWMTGEYAWIVHILAALAFRLSGCWGLFRWNPPRGCWSLRKFRVWVDQWTLIVSHVCGFVGARKIEAKVGIK